MGYINQNDLQKVTTGLVDQKVKDLIEKRIKSNFKLLPVKTFENNGYYSVNQLDTALDNTINELSGIISQNINAKQVDIKRINHFQKNEYGVPLFHRESITNYVDSVLSKYDFM